MVPAQLAPSTLSLPDARQIFGLRQVKDVLWAGIDEILVPQYLSDNIDRILAITSETHETNEGFARTIIDQILICAIIEENQTQTAQQQAPSQPEDPTVLELQHQTQLQHQVTYRGETRLLSGYADYTIRYESQETTSNLATNIIIIEAKKIHSTDTYLAQLTAYMGIIHAQEKDKLSSNSIIYGAVSDGHSFRFCCIDTDGNWSQSRLLEWSIGDQSKIYSVFRSLIRTAASSSTIKNLQREKVFVSFGSPRCTGRFHRDLNALELLEEDDEVEIVSWRGSSLGLGRRLMF